MAVRNVSGGVFLGLLPYLEQGPLYDAMNFSVNIFTAINATISATGITTLWCPSDSGVERSPDLARRQLLRPRAVHDVLTPATPATSGPGTWAGVRSTTTRLNGLFNADGAVGLASVTDGTSNTIAFGEHAADDPRPRRSALTGTGGPRAPLATRSSHALPDESAEGRRRTSPTVEHAYRADGIEPAPRRRQLRVPGRLGPVPQGHDRLLEDRPGHRVAPGISFDSTGLVQVAPGTRFGVYQALSTRNGGEVISADSY